MAWTAPRTWIVGEVVTAAIMNTHIRDNQKALSDLAANSFLNPFPLGAWAQSPGAALGSSTDIDLAGTSSIVTPINFDAFNARSATVQWRMSAVFNVSVIVPGAPSAVTWTARYAFYANRGAVTAPGAFASLGAGVNLFNLTGIQAADSGWNAIVASGLWSVHPAWFCARTGGSGNGSVTTCFYFLEARNQ